MFAIFERMLLEQADLTQRNPANLTILLPLMKSGGNNE